MSARHPARSARFCATSASEWQPRIERSRSARLCCLSTETLTIASASPEKRHPTGVITGGSRPFIITTPPDHQCGPRYSDSQQFSPARPWVVIGLIDPSPWPIPRSNPFLEQRLLNAAAKRFASFSTARSGSAKIGRDIDVIHRIIARPSDPPHTSLSKRFPTEAS